MKLINPILLIAVFCLVALSIALPIPDSNGPEMTIRIDPVTDAVEITSTDIIGDDWCHALRQAIDKYCEEHTL